MHAIQFNLIKLEIGSSAVDVNVRISIVDVVYFTIQAAPLAAKQRLHCN